MTVRDIYDALDAKYGFASQADWDNSGVTAGDESARVAGVYVALDVTNESVENAKKAGANLIVSHHPCIFYPIKQIPSVTSVYAAIAAGLSLIALHTPLDRADEDGTCSALFEKIGAAPAGGSTVCPYLKFADLPEETDGEGLARLLKEKLGGGVTYTAPAGAVIKRIAAATGSAGEFADDAFREGADAFITGEIKYHPLLNARDRGQAVFAAGHYETEAPAMEKVASYLRQSFPGLAVTLEKSGHPISFI